MKSTTGTSTIKGPLKSKEIIEIINALKDTEITQFKFGDLEITLKNLTREPSNTDNTQRNEFSLSQIQAVNSLGNETELTKTDEDIESLESTLAYLQEENAILNDPESFERSLKIGN